MTFSSHNLEGGAQRRKHHRREPASSIQEQALSGRIACVAGDITRFTGDAIVNAANTALRGGGGVDGAIHRAAGPSLLAECVERYPDGCATGEARPTGGHDLAARFVIHTPGPVYQDGNSGEPELLAACYTNALNVAAELDCATVAFPAISCGIYGYPVDNAAQIALTSIASALETHAALERVTMVLFSDELLGVFEAALRQISD